ncbi:MAG: hypothetical protein AAFQ98_11005 [Bacteroidota bacterium]
MKSVSPIVIALVLLLVGCQNPEEKALEEFEGISEWMDTKASSYPGLGPCFRKMQRERETRLSVAMREEAEERLALLLTLNQEYTTLLHKLDSLPIWRGEFYQLRDSLVEEMELPFQAYDQVKKEEDNMEWAWRVVMIEGPDPSSCEQAFVEQSLRAEKALAEARRLAKLHL